MPRGPTPTKRQSGVANQRDTRHENGLVGPGKRVQKQRSNHHLNGHVKPAEHNLSTPPLPSTPPHGTNGHARQPEAVDSQSVDIKMGSQSARRPSFGAYSESSSSESFHTQPGISVSQENHRRIDVNATKDPAVHRDVGPLSLALTVLRSCPLYDTIAILIVLLQLPPTFLSLVHLLFATLTFVPSNSSGSPLSFADVFEGAMGTPSIATVVVVDLLVLLVWLFLWSPLQDIALDLAQTVIALTLGGGTNGKEAGLKNVLVCFGLIGAQHLAQNGNVKQSGIRALLSSSSDILGSSTDPDDPLEPIPRSGSKKGAHGWIQSILAIHILAQGVVRFVRELYMQSKLREKRDSSISISDPEAGKTLPDSPTDSSTPGPQPADDSTSSFPPGNVINTKKKKKQNAAVRVRQPLWAALASTKIVMVKEYETSQTAAESAGTNATDINNLGNAPFNTEADRIWITYVGYDEVCFSTSYFPSHTPPQNCEEKNVDSSGVDKSKPFFVRVNKTVWQPTKINPTIDPDGPVNQDKRWSGELYGLAPASSYECDFVSTIDNSIIFSTSVRTPQPPTADTSVGVSPNAKISGRPNSPTTTLKSSIASAEQKLADEKVRQKRERKDQKIKLNGIRKEIERLANSTSTSGGNDDRVKQKIQQNNLHMKQAEDALVDLAAEITSLEVIPAADAANYAASKAEYYSEKDKHKKLRAEISDDREAAEREISALSSELTTVQGKKDRAQLRIVKLNGEHERITDANARGLDEAQRKDRERHAKELERATLEASYVNSLTNFEASIITINEAVQALHAGIIELERQEAYATANPSASVPNLNALPGYTADMMTDGGVTSYPWNPNMPNPNMPYMGYGTQMPVNPQGSFRTRGRSSSMLSNLSGFTQSDDEALCPAYPPQMGKAVWDSHEKGRHGSSGSGSGSGSIGDPKSPVVGNGKLAK